MVISILQKKEPNHLMQVTELRMMELRFGHHSPLFVLCSTVLCHLSRNRIYSRSLNLLDHTLLSHYFERNSVKGGQRGECVQQPNLIVPHLAAPLVQVNRSDSVIVCP